ncbi:mitochondrial carrier [Venturia nashicola]|uniref:Mitochondrial thiamine pyrophosphate carrier 1 n=1 Tax=Venturia nashicola TaxID=86259 RepID=A0A4Z1NZZ0_9PEZI|nr:mitochondrial carrier [Venturia nashicola]
MPTSIVSQHEPPAQQNPTESANKQDMTTTIHAEPSALARPRRSQPLLCPTDADAIMPDAKPKMDKQSVEYALKSGLAGGLAGCAAKTLVAPLDRVKVLFQTANPEFKKYTGSWRGVGYAMREIYGQEGLFGLFRGHSATLLRIFPYAGIKFLAYEQVRAVVIPSRDKETHIRRFASGSIAGCVSVFFTYPLEVIRVRLAFETRQDSKHTLTSICRKIYGEKPPIRIPDVHIDTSTPKNAILTTAEVAAAKAVKSAPSYGFINFYRGFTPTLWGMLPYAGASFLAHDSISDLLRRGALAPITTVPKTAGSAADPYKPAQLKWWAELTSGGLAGFISQTVSYPLEVIRRRMQVGGAVGDGHRLRMGEVTRRVFREKGWRGFFVGLGVGYMKIIPMTATSFYVYERSKYHLGI